MATLQKNRYALLIACQNYKDPDLRQLAAPGNDVEALAQVLRNPQIGGFQVKTVINQSWWKVQQAIAQFFVDRDRRDVLLLYFSCHGVKSDDGHLYFAASDTNRKLLRASSVPDDFVQELMGASRAFQQILILDCCYGGYFTNRMLAKGDSSVDDVATFQSRGAVILTASNAIQYAFEGDHLKNNSSLSLFTGCIVKGLSTGAADLDRDGQVSVDDLAGYAQRQMRIEAPGSQTPTLSSIGKEGEIFIAAVPPRLRKKWQTGARISPSPDGWLDLGRNVDFARFAKRRFEVLFAMEISLAIRGKKVSLSDDDLLAKLSKLSKSDVSQTGFIPSDIIHIIDYQGVRAVGSKKIYTARSYPLDSYDDILGQLRMGRPVVTGMFWRQRWLLDPILKTGKLDLQKTDQIAGATMITIVACNEEDQSLRFFWRPDWGDHGLGWMDKPTAQTCLDRSFRSIEAVEFSDPYSR